MKTKQTLFDLPEVDQMPDGSCAKCEHSARPHTYRRDWLYCDAMRDNRTQFGVKRVKARAVCEMFLLRKKEDADDE